MNKTILDEAADIVVHRKTDHTGSNERPYGPFSESMGRATMIFNGMTGLDVDVDVMYKALIALKLSRESYHHKRDNLVDTCGYLQGLEDLYNGEERG